MDRRSVYGAVAVVALCTGCAAHNPAVAKATAAPAQVEAPSAAPVKPATQALAVTVSEGTERRYVDGDLGFEISRPSAAWQLEASNEQTPEGLTIPVVLRHEESGAQVVLQVAPAVATPTQFAERLTSGLRSHPGVTTTEPEPLPMADGAVGFRFAMGDRVLGRVAVLEGNKGQVFMMMATWPTTAPATVNAGVEEIFDSLKSVPRI